MSAEELVDWPSQRRRIIGDGIGVGVATGAYGVSFGAVSVAAGLSVGQTCALSLLMFTGASQFALVGVAAAGGLPIAGVVTAWLLGVRNSVYGLKLASLLQWQGWRRYAAAHLVIDESTAMAIGRTHQAAARVGFLSTGLSIFLLWNLATLAGAVAGAAFAQPKTLGLDAAVGAAFLALLWPWLSDPGHRITALVAAAVALVTLPFVPPGVPVLIAGGWCLVANLTRNTSEVGVSQ